MVTGLTSGLRLEEDVNYAVLCYYAASSGNFVPTFRNNLLESSYLKSVPIRCPETSAGNYHYSLRNNPEQRSSRGFGVSRGFYDFR